MAALAGLAVVGAWTLLRPHAGDERHPSAAPGAGKGEGAAVASVAARVGAVRRGLPKLRTLSALDWELLGAADAQLTPPQREALADLDRSARQTAAEAVHLPPGEAAQVAAVYQRSDGELAALEARVDPERGTLAGPIVGRLHHAARAELTALTELLGPERARALRTATNLAYRQRWAAASDGAPPLAVVSVARRKMTFLWMGMGGEDAPEDPDAEE